MRRGRLKVLCASGESLLGTMSCGRAEYFRQLLFERWRIDIGWGPGCAKYKAETRIGVCVECLIWRSKPRSSRGPLSMTCTMY